MLGVVLYLNVLVAAAVSPIGETVDFQIHSYDDMRLWPQVFRKGARFIKLDPQYQGSTFCSTQKRANRSDHRGCLIFNHDTASILKKRLDYNTTEDLVAVLDSPHPTLLPYLKQKNSTLFFALCFKNMAIPCSSKSWIALVDNLFARLNAAVQKNALNVEFVLDGGSFEVRTRRSHQTSTACSLHPPARPFPHRLPSLLCTGLLQPALAAMGVHGWPVLHRRRRVLQQRPGYWRRPLAGVEPKRRQPIQQGGESEVGKVRQ
jgi:hypothetical protein